MSVSTRRMVIPIHAVGNAVSITALGCTSQQPIRRQKPPAPRPSLPKFSNSSAFSGLAPSQPAGVPEVPGRTIAHLRRHGGVVCYRSGLVPSRPTQPRIILYRSVFVSPVFRLSSPGG